MRFMEWLQLIGKILHGNNYLWLVMKKSSVSRMQKVYVFSDSVLCLGKMHQNPPSNTVWQDKLTWFKSSYQWTQLMVSQWNSSGIFPRIHHIAARRQSPRVHKQNGRPSAIRRTNFLHVEVQWHQMVNYRQRTGMRIKRQPPFYLCEKIFTRSFLGPGSEKKWHSTFDSKPQGEWDRVAELMMIKISESGHPVFRATSPLSRGMLKSRGGGKLSIHFCADEGTIETVFRTLSLLSSSVSTEQSQICVVNAAPAM